MAGWPSAPATAAASFRPTSSLHFFSLRHCRRCLLPPAALPLGSRRRPQVWVPIPSSSRRCGYLEGYVRWLRPYQAAHGGRGRARGDRQEQAEAGVGEGGGRSEEETVTAGAGKRQGWLAAYSACGRPSLMAFSNCLTLRLCWTRVAIKKLPFSVDFSCTSAWLTTLVMNRTMLTNGGQYQFVKNVPADRELLRLQTDLSFQIVHHLSPSPLFTDVHPPAICKIQIAYQRYLPAIWFSKFKFDTTFLHGFSLRYGPDIITANVVCIL